MPQNVSPIQKTQFEMVQPFSIMAKRNPHYYEHNERKLEIHPDIRINVILQDRPTEM